MTGTLDLTFVVTPALSAGLTYEPPVREDMEGVLRYPHSGRLTYTLTGPAGAAHGGTLSETLTEAQATTT